MLDWTNRCSYALREGVDNALSELDHCFSRVTKQMFQHPRLWTNSLLRFGETKYFCQNDEMTHNRVIAYVHVLL